MAVCLATPPLLGWGVYAYLPNQSFCFCDWRTSASYTFFMVGTCFGGPCSVMTFCYVKIVREIRASRRRIIEAQKKGYKSMQQTSNGDAAKDGTGSNSKARSLLNPLRGASNLGANQIHPGSSNADKGGGSNVTLTAVQPFEKRDETSSEANAAVSQHGKSNSENRKSPEKDAKRKTITDDPLSPKSKKAEKRRQEHIRLAISFAVVILVFIISWLPFCVTMFLNVFMPNPIPRIPDMITLLLGCANSLCNPIIYGVMNTRFRVGYERLFSAPFRKLGIKCCERKQNESGNTLMMNETLSSRSK